MSAINGRPVSPAIEGLSPATYDPVFGFRVTKSEDLSGTQDDLFTVTGLVQITSLVGVVTNAIGAGVVDYVMRIKTINAPINTGVDLSIGVVNSLFALSGDGNFYTETSGNLTKFVRLENKLTAYVGSPGGSCTIEGTHSAGDANDAITWILHYRPLEAGASIAAAA